MIAKISISDISLNLEGPSAPSAISFVQYVRIFQLKHLVMYIAIVLYSGFHITLEFFMISLGITL